MEFKAFKMDGLGNDFVIIDNRSNNVELNKDQIIKICDRNFIGCDQLVYINNSDNADADLEFYNSDGSAADACGNGTRCVAFLLSKEKDTKNISVQVASKQLNSKLLDDGQVETIIGVPKTNWNEIPLSKKLTTKNLGINISTGINNLFDTRYASGIVINARGFGGRDPRFYYPGLPRNYFISLSISI